ncbi:13120_t:CDS:2, partial [Cetraspora pellucida]
IYSTLVEPAGGIDSINSIRGTPPTLVRVELTPVGLVSDCKPSGSSLVFGNFLTRETVPRLPAGGAQQLRELYRVLMAFESEQYAREAELETNMIQPSWPSQVSH